MRRSFVLLCLLAVSMAVFAFSACSKEETFLPDLTRDDIVGTWIYTADNGDTVSYRFNDNNIYVRTENIGAKETKIKGQFTVVDNKVCMFTDEGAEDLDREIKKFDGNTLVWIDSIYGEMELKKT